MARSVLGFFLFYGRMGCPDFDGPELLHVACSIAKCLTKIWGDGFRNFLNGEVSNLLKDYFFSQYWGENLQWYSTVQWSRVACLQMFENVFIVGYILFFFFFNLSFTFYLVGGNILSLLFCHLMLTRRIARPVCLHVFTPTREGIENKEF